MQQTTQEVLHRVRHSRLPLLKDVFKTINNTRPESQAFDASYLHAAYMAAISSQLQAVKAKARGDGTHDRLLHCYYVPDCRLTPPACQAIFCKKQGAARGLCGECRMPPETEESYLY